LGKFKFNKYHKNNQVDLFMIKQIHWWVLKLHQINNQVWTKHLNFVYVGEPLSDLIRWSYKLAPNQQPKWAYPNEPWTKHLPCFCSCYWKSNSLVVLSRHSNPSYVSSIVVPIVGRTQSLEFCNQKERKKTMISRFDLGNKERRPWFGDLIWFLNFSNVWASCILVLANPFVDSY
jgi:hypothetical protein